MARPPRLPLIGAIVLAAGASTRFGSPKQQLLLPEVLERVRESSVDDVVVVLGAHDVDTDARVVRCPEWERGPGASLRCGLESLGPDTEAAVVVLATRAPGDYRRDSYHVTISGLQETSISPMRFQAG
ncbi:MAG: hypothetical protein E6G42_07920 [Actinobacteria bacterium]|nr:MAG: hypothetical protein E6G42_07920 [Actinomycetota bacterium]